MALGIYKLITGTSYSSYSSDGSGDSPISSLHDGRTTGDQTLQLFLRNDDLNVYYTNIVISCVQTDAGTEYLDNSTSGWGIKLRSGVSEPTQEEWDITDWNNQLSMSNIGTSTDGDTTTYAPFWYLIQHPAQIPADIVEVVKLRVEAIERAVV